MMHYLNASEIENRPTYWKTGGFVISY